MLPHTKKENLEKESKSHDGLFFTVVSPDGEKWRERSGEEMQVERVGKMKGEWRWGWKLHLKEKWRAVTGRHSFGGANYLKKLIKNLVESCEI